MEEETFEVPKPIGIGAEMVQCGSVDALHLRMAPDSGFSGKAFWKSWPAEKTPEGWERKYRRGSSDVHVFLECVMTGDDEFGFFNKSADLRMHLMVPKDVVSGIEAGDDPDSDQAFADLVAGGHPLFEEGDLEAFRKSVPIYKKVGKAA